MIALKAQTALKQQLTREVLPLVQKPSRYLGNELNIIRKDHGDVSLKVALCYPDTYEIGMSHQGLRILYHILNKRSDVVAERTYLPWVDMQEQMRSRSIPLYTLESYTPVQEFDLLGISLQTELTFTNILNVLDLSGLEFRAVDRTEDDPIIIGGGPCAFNPEPLADFFDCFLIGDAEKLLPQVCDEIVAGKEIGLGKEDLLLRLAGFEGMYVPRFYAATSQHPMPRPTRPGVPAKVVPALMPELRREDFPTEPLVPMTEVIHDRLAIEAARGCPRNCRFCQATILYRPARERSQDSIQAIAREGIDASGYEEISPLSLSIADYSGVEGMLAELSREFTPERVGISLPSLRVETFTENMVQSVKTVRKNGLTFAPEGGSQRLRNAINKNFPDEDIFKAVDAAFKNGWQLVKLYFMIGLPTEDWEDLDELVRLVKEVVKVGKKYPGKKRVHVGISPFVPKPHTPFQWERQILPDETKEKVRYIKHKLGRQPAIDLKWHDANETMVDGILARGDRSLSSVLIDVYKQGGRFDGWGEHFRFDRWLQVLNAHGYDLETLTRERSTDEELPWDFIDSKVDRAYLLRERERAWDSKATPDCGPPRCQLCGVCDDDLGLVLSNPDQYRVRKKRNSENEVEEPNTYIQVQFPSVPVQEKKVYRIHYGKQAELRFISHLDLKQVIERTIRRVKLPVAYSEGFNPHIKLSFSAPLSLGWRSRAEYFDLELAATSVEDERGVLTGLRTKAPDGLQFYKAKRVLQNGAKPKSLMAEIERSWYMILLSSLPLRVRDQLTEDDLNQHLIATFANRSLILRRERKGMVKEVDVRAYVYDYGVVGEGENMSIELLLENSSKSMVRPTEVMGRVFGLTPEEILLLDVEKTGSLVCRAGEWLSPMDKSVVAKGESAEQLVQAYST